MFEHSRFLLFSLDCFLRILGRNEYSFGIGKEDIVWFFLFLSYLMRKGRISNSLSDEVIEEAERRSELVKRAPS